jgi:sulfonate transport system ATP-binding protein
MSRQPTANEAARIRRLRKSFGSHLVFDALDLDVARGERVAILGVSGCGKSTLLRCIAGLERPDDGTIVTAGEIGIVFQEPRLFPWLDVRRNVAFAARNDAERARVDNVLALVGMLHVGDRLPKALSGGMAQRVALARSLVRDPALLLLDEPFAALDALRRIELRAAVREILEFTRAASSCWPVRRPRSSSAARSARTQPARPSSPHSASATKASTPAAQAQANDLPAGSVRDRPRSGG